MTKLVIKTTMCPTYGLNRFPPNSRLSDDLLEVDVLLDEGLHGGVELLDLGVVLRRLSQGDDRLGQFGGMLSDVAAIGGNEVSW